MSPIAPALQEYFTQRLISQRQASPHTVAAYRDCFRLLFAYMAQDAAGSSQPSSTSRTSTPARSAGSSPTLRKNAA